MITAKSIGTLVVFIVSMIFVIHPVHISVPLPHFGRRKIPVNLTTAPIVAIAILWAAQCIGSGVIRDGIVGTEGIKPYNILILFFSLAYMAITLDVTGILQSAAYWVSNKGGDNGRKLFFYFYVMLTLLSVVIGNDPVILSGTAFLVYYTQVVELQPLPWLISEFAAANTASMVLFVGNPTNVVICEGFGVNNAAFTLYTIFPFLACNVACYIALAVQYRSEKHLRRQIKPKQLNPRSVLLEPVSAWVGSTLLGSCLVVIIVVSFFNVEVWKISLPFAVAKFIFDLTWDYYRWVKDRPVLGRRRSDPAEKLPSEQLDSVEKPMSTQSVPVAGLTSQSDLEATSAQSDPKKVTPEEKLPSVKFDSENPINESKDQRQKRQSSKESQTSNVSQSSDGSQSTSKTLVNGDVTHKQFSGAKSNMTHLHTDSDRPVCATELPPLAESPSRIESPAPTEPALVIEPPPISERAIRVIEPSASENAPPKVDSRSPSPLPFLDGAPFRIFLKAFPRLPFALVPFAFSQFILIEALSHQGWIDVFATWLVRASHFQIYPTIWLIGVLGVVLCNLSGTNIGATILLTKVVRAANMPNHTLRAAAIALAVASNIGAVSFTFSASLAGLLWRSILEQKKIHVTQRQFARWNLLPIIVMTTIGLSVVSIEMAVLYGGKVS